MPIATPNWPASGFTMAEVRPPKPTPAVLRAALRALEDAAYTLGECDSDEATAAYNEARAVVYAMLGLPLED